MSPIITSRLVDGGDTPPISTKPSSPRYPRKAKKRRTRRIGGRGRRRHIPSPRSSRERRRNHPSGRKASPRYKIVLSLESPTQQNYPRIRKVDCTETAHEYPMVKLTIFRRPDPRGRSLPLTQTISSITNSSNSLAVYSYICVRSMEPSGFKRALRSFLSIDTYYQPYCSALIVGIIFTSISVLNLQL